MTEAPWAVLDGTDWRVRRDRHQARVDAWIQPHLQRRQARQPHPVEDFLFTYYSHRPAALRRWHPGWGRVLGGTEATSYLDQKGYVEVSAGSATGASGVTLSRRYVASQRPLLSTLDTLLRATAGRPGHYGCFGMHEWAMVHGLDPSAVRHSSWPLRLGGAGTDEVVESHRVTCSHFDAFRFFTPSARPRNTLQPTRDDRPDFEQPGCLHAGMDLYKHAFRLSPMVCSDLVADCFELARDSRVLDMRASPYDLSALGYEPVRIETPEGKQEYAAAQRGFAERGAPLRARIMAECDRLLSI